MPEGRERSGERLASCLNKSRMRTRDIPEELLKIFCELIASAEGTFRASDAHEFLARLLFKIPPDLQTWLFEKRFPVHPFIDNMDPRRIFPGMTQSPRVLRIRWRLLKRRLTTNTDETYSTWPAQNSGQVQTPWRGNRDRSSLRPEPGRRGEENLPAASRLYPDHSLDITLSDLRFLINAARQHERVKSVWRIHGKAIASKEAMTVPDVPALKMKRLYWGGARSRKNAFWERLIVTQAGELSEIRRLAHEISSRTGRVVLSWHNASLGAAGGWAFEDLAAQFDSATLYRLFVQAVSKEAEKIRESFDFSSAMGLCAMRSERLFAPKMANAVELCPVMPFISGDGMSGHGGAEEAWEKSSGVNGNKYEWPGALSLHQRISPRQVSAWIERAGKTWADGLILLSALANQGQRMLDSGRVHSLVLPWIDKFFISSRRQADVVYLERLFGFVSANIKQPLILFWDDTTHGRAPSLGLALEGSAGRGLPFRAIGIFNTGLSGGHGAERADAVRIILEEYPQKALFALRPVNENHCPDSFRWIFEDLDARFFFNYDSSWKDNLAFIYAGTQVFPLLAVQTERESVSPWVFSGRERYAFGAWFRRILRHISLGKSEEASEPFCLRLQSLANLL